ncbi:MAG: putative adhesin [Paenibacillaceae bacterium]|jgi:DUF4097 and DUF4098 domain-containing protein YvlB|nr:putative adhesin [Paenibacillaceae bacterium]
MLKVGRYTAALLLMTVGVMLFLDQTGDSDYLALLLDWWPVVLISLGVEYLLFNMLYHKGDRQLRLDMGGLILSVLISAVVVGTTQVDRFPTQWLKNIDFNIDNLNLSFSSESGHSFTKEPVIIPFGDNVEKIVIDNPNGNVEIKTGNSQDIEVQTTVWVDKVDEEEAWPIAEQSYIEHSEGSQLRITASGKEYTGDFPNKRKPRMNVVVLVPPSRKADYELILLNGKIDAAMVPVSGKFKVRTTNGAITITGIDSQVDADTTNGSIDLYQIGGDASANTTNGTVTAKAITGKLEVDTTNGAVSVEDALGAVDVETLNGKISIKEAAGSVKADATNGAITVHSSRVGGDYELKNLASSIEVRIPGDADVEVKGSTSFSSISTDLPLTVEGKKLSGIIGNGRYKISIETNNKIQVNKID